MSQLISNVVVATVAIAKMREDQREQLLYSLLEKHPSMVIKVMKENNIKFNELDEFHKRKFKVVINNMGSNIIAVIKKVRDMFGFGLADAKAWTEGSNVSNIQSGVFGRDLSYNEANKLSLKLEREIGNGFISKVILDEEHYTWVCTQDWSGR